MAVRATIRALGLLSVGAGAIFANHRSYVRQDTLLQDAFQFWNMFRDNGTGLWCDSLRFDGYACGAGNKFYSSAGTGMGLVTDCIQAELSFISKGEGRDRALQTISTILDSWPREPHHGFFAHFAEGLAPAQSTEYSTIDTAEMTAGAIFAGNFFGGEVLEKAERLFNLTDWSQALKSERDPDIFSTIDPITGAMGLSVKPFNEYYIVAYLAKRQNRGSKANRYFETFFGTTGKPVGAYGFPQFFNYSGYELISDHGGAVSSFIPQFCYFLTHGFHENAYYSQQLFQDWLHADMKFWDLALSNSSQIWGQPVKGRVWGSGAGPYPGGYTADGVDNDQTLTFSAPIMAGFLPAADVNLKELITSQLRYLYDKEICAYPVVGVGKVLWRCSVESSWWRADTADSIDFSTMVLGYSSLFLEESFYGKYAASTAKQVTDVIIL